MSQLDAVVRAAGGRIRAALAARFRDLDLAEDSFAEACARAAAHWRDKGAPVDPAAWLYQVASRVALDEVRKRSVRARAPLDPDAAPVPSAEEALMSDDRMIPDERLRLIFICCHPAVAPDARAALTLRMVCGLSTEEIARAFLLPESTLAQRLVRAKRKIAAAGIPFEVPGPEAWSERMNSILSTLEIAYAKAHEDAGGRGRHAEYAAEMLRLTALLAELAPAEADVLALAATLRFAEARRPARVDAAGRMVPLSDQDPALWNVSLIRDGHAFLGRALRISRPTRRILQAAIHGTWCARAPGQPPPWTDVLQLYDRLLRFGEDPIVRLNRAVALAQVRGADVALAEIEALDTPALQAFLPYHALRADLLRRLERREEAASGYDVALALGPGPAERAWLLAQRATVTAAKAGAQLPSPAT